jgi:hypothetical protein
MQLTGCAEVDSENIKTSGIRVDADISLRDESVSVIVDLETSNNFTADNIVLTSGDRLTATLAGETIELNRANDRYIGSFQGPFSGDELTISLSRPDDVDAANSVINLPVNFNISAPDDGATYNAGEQISVSSTPVHADVPISIRYGVRCTLREGSESIHGGRIGRTFNDITDTGVHTVAVNSVLNALDDQEEIVPDIACPLEIEVSRKTTGTLDPALKGGELTAGRRDIVTGTVIP